MNNKQLHIIFMGTPDFAVEEWVKRSMTYGNFLPVDTVREINNNYDVRVIGGV